ncbi:MAG: hemolysin family protein [Nocardioides sp.]
MSDLTSLLLATGLLFGNAFFVGAEFALVSARRSQIEPRAHAGSRFAAITLRAMENMSLVIGVNQLGITVCSLVLGAVGEPAVAHLIEPVLQLVGVSESFLHPIAFVVSLSIVVFLHVVIGEMVPKNLALAGPDRAALVLGPPIWAIATLLRPPVAVINAIARWILRRVGVEIADEVSSTFTREEVTAMVEESRGEGLIEPGEYVRLAGALGFAEKTVESVLMPMAGLATIREGAPVAEVETLCGSTGFSRFPVIANSGEVIGYVHVKDALECDDDARSRPIGPHQIRQFADVRRGSLLHEALEALQRRGAHMARVSDDDGLLLGIVTLEDVLEELVGEIRDAAHHPESA